MGDLAASLRNVFASLSEEENQAISRQARVLCHEADLNFLATIAVLDGKACLWSPVPSVEVDAPLKDLEF